MRHIEKHTGDGPRYTWPFQVRHYELNPSRSVRPEVYLNWMQEAGLLASASAGYPLERYESIGAFWWVHRFRIEWHSAVEYGDCLEATTWISRFRRISALREYEIRRSEDHSVACCAQADWAFVDTSTGHPSRVPEDMLSCFPPRCVEAVASLPWVWDSPGDGNYLFTTQRTVQYHELDSMGHVNHAFYLTWLLDALKEYAVGLGIGESLHIVPERFDIEYLQSVGEDEPLVVTCRLVDWAHSSARWEHEIRLQGGETVAARARSVCRFNGLSDASLPEDCVDALARGFGGVSSLLVGNVE